ncbi:uncharacterized protein [Arachis hypogaea]|uniref:uncharacterized protein n=1 Tax=Arachis hypogaea TaxID=3818 RepID=UPI003B210A76
MANTFNIVWSGPKLDGKLDYSYWETLMSTHLKAQNLWNFIEPGLQEGADAAQQRRDQLALSQIHQGVYYKVFGKIANAKSAKEAWNTLKLSYKGVDKAQKAKLQSLRREYERYEMSSSETVEQYFTRITDLVNKMRVYGEDMPDSKVVEKILRTMPMKYDHVVTTILESHNMDTMTIVELQGTMESHISRILEKSKKSIEEALKSRVNFNNVAESSRTQEGRGRGFNFQSRGRGSFRGRGRGNYSQGRGGTNFKSVNRGRGRGNFYQERTNFNCFHCGKYGHKAADCRFKMVNNNQAHVAENQHQNTDDNPGKSWRARRLLEIVHLDLCSVEVPSNGGSRYFITFIDDFSRYTWVYFLKQKSKACDVFKTFKAFVEKQSGCKIKILRKDRGTEYLACSEYFKQHGINTN